MGNGEMGAVLGKGQTKGVVPEKEMDVLVCGRLDQCVAWWIGIPFSPYPIPTTLPLVSSCMALDPLITTGRHGHF